MEKKILIVGTEHIAGLAATKLLEMGHKNVEIISPEQAKNMRLEPESIPYTRPKPELHTYQEKEFICKGRHQYREVKSEYSDGTAWFEWVCQCGKKL